MTESPQATQSSDPGDQALAHPCSARPPDGCEVDGPVVAVMVMEDRAQITRRASVELPGDTSHVTVRPVTPLIADRTLRCRVRPDAEPLADDPSPRLIDCRVRRRYLVRSARPESSQELDQAIDAQADDYRAAGDALQIDFHERELLKLASEAVARQIRDRLVVGAFESRSPDDVARVFERRGELEARILAEQWKQDERRERIRRLVDEKRLALTPSAHYEATITAELWVPRPGRYTVEWMYVVPCALWRPTYTAELRTRDPAGASCRVRWQSAGTVWQATGEDWLNVQLACSTARPALGAEAPLLSDDLLRSREKSDRERRVIEVSSRDETIAQTGADVDAPTDAALRLTDTPPGLDDGGEARTYRVAEPMTVPTDGRPHQIDFETFETDARSDRVCLPEKAPYVFLRSRQVNASSLPLLAGPVSIVRNGGYVGRSQIAYVGPGETFEMSWGSEDGLVVLRDVEQDYEETKIRKRRRYRFTIRDHIANHTGAACALKLSERIPVSEIEHVETTIIDADTTPRYTRDDHGRVSWDLTLEAGEGREIILVFDVLMPQHVVWHG